MSKAQDNLEDYDLLEVRRVWCWVIMPALELNENNTWNDSNTIPAFPRAQDYIQAVEDYQNAVSNSNGLSYTSSFGEYNPGGGKDAVEKYLILSAKEAQTARDCLGRILKTLGQI